MKESRREEGKVRMEEAGREGQGEKEVGKRVWERKKSKLNVHNHS